MKEKQKILKIYAKDQISEAIIDNDLTKLISSLLNECNMLSGQKSIHCVVCCTVLY